MPEIDPEMAGILADLAERELGTMTPADARAEAEVRNAYWNEDPPALDDVRMLTIAGPRGPLRLRLYTPSGGAGRLPCVLYIHGGGWVICSLDTHDGICRRLALAGGFMVASVDYGLAPEHPFPHGLDDCLAAIRWLAEHGAAEGADPTQLALAGDSAGANLALAACIALRDHGESLVRAAALVYGVFSADNDSPSHVAFGDGRYVLSTAAMEWFWDHYVKDPARRGDPLAAPAERRPSRTAAPLRLGSRARSVARRQRALGASPGGRRHRSRLPVVARCHACLLWHEPPALGSSRVHRRDCGLSGPSTPVTSLSKPGLRPDPGKA